jgi:predicted CXXCH cytochrome family protein
MRWLVRAAGIGGFAVLVALATAGSVRADGGPHSIALNSGTSGLSGDCASCHRAHTASATDLLTAETPTLCLNCHNGTKATTDVVDGIQYATGSGMPYNGGVPNSPANVVGALRGGGFTYALMDTSWTGAPTSRPVTSAHAYDGATAQTMWGNAATGAGKTGVDLTCVDCHNPHGDNAYRILRQLPTGSDAITPITVPDEPVKTYTVSSALDRYFGQVYGAQAGNATPPLEQWQWMYLMDQWCVQCHTRYDGLGAGSGLGLRVPAHHALADRADRLRAVPSEQPRRSPGAEPLRCHRRRDGARAGLPELPRRPWDGGRHERQRRPGRLARRFGHPVRQPAELAAPARQPRRVPGLPRPDGQVGRALSCSSRAASRDAALP